MSRAALRAALNPKPHKRLRDPTIPRLNQHTHVLEQVRSDGYGVGVTHPGAANSAPTRWPSPSHAPRAASCPPASRCHSASLGRAGRRGPSADATGGSFVGVDVAEQEPAGAEAAEQAGELGGGAAGFVGVGEALDDAGAVGAVAGARLPRSGRWRGRGSRRPSDSGFDPGTWVTDQSSSAGNSVGLGIQHPAPWYPGGAARVAHPAASEL